jgi:tetratricopeptide (TPR) repeat protein
MKSSQTPHRYVPARFLLFLLIVGFALPSWGQAPMTERDRLIEEELDYITGLQEWGLPDYAQLVIEKFKEKYPDAMAKIRVAELRGLLAVGDFEKVKQTIARQPDPNAQETWAMKLALADGYYAWGKYAEAQGIYEAFLNRFPSGPGEALNDFYRDSVYKYAQMLMLMGKDKAALDAYKALLRAKLERHIERQIKGEMAELMIKLGEAAGPGGGGYYAEAEKIANDLLWVQDLWFGRGIVFLAHIRMLEGKPDEATKLIDDYYDDLMAIHNALVEQSGEEDLTRLSPMAQCRYMLGSMMLEEAEKLIKNGGTRERLSEATEPTSTSSRCSSCFPVPSGLRKPGSRRARSRTS